MTLTAHPGLKGSLICFHGATPVAERFMVVGNHAKKPITETLSSGNSMVKGLRIFKVGTFKDSMGIEHTWESLHLDQMVAHFNLLTESNIFPNVPVRADHSWSVKDVVGYIRAIYRDPEDANFLACDVEFTEPDAFEKWERGTYSSRSLEVGMYETNDGATFFPTVFGLAFVDIPAVEGLHGAPAAPLRYSHVVTDQETPNMDPLTLWLASNPGKTADDWKAGCEYAQALADEEAWVAAATYAQALADQAAQHAKPPSQEPPTPGGPAPQPQPMAFRIGGQMTTDYSAIQLHIDTLEAVAEETKQGVRRDFVRSLVTDNKLPATDEAGEQALVSSFSDEQFAIYRRTKEASPVHPLLGQYGQQAGPAGAPLSPSAGSGALPQNQPKPSSDPHALALSIVRQHKRAGQSVEFIKATKSYKDLEAAGKAPDLTTL